MKTCVKLSDIRKGFKNANQKTISNCLTIIYSLKEKQRNELKDFANSKEFKTLAEDLKKEYNELVEYNNLLNKILPGTRKLAQERAQEIYEWGKVGQIKTITKQDGTTKDIEIKPSVDMVLRFFVQDYNKAIPEANVTLKKTSKAKEDKKTSKDNK